MFKCGIYLIGEFCLLPSHMALVFPAFKKRPDLFPNISMIFIVLSNEFLSPSNITPQWGAADAEIKVPSGENTELKRSPFKA